MCWVLSWTLGMHQKNKIPCFYGAYIQLHACVLMWGEVWGWQINKQIRYKLYQGLCTVLCTAAQLMSSKLRSQGIQGSSYPPQDRFCYLLRVPPIEGPDQELLSKLSSFLVTCGMELAIQAGYLVPPAPIFSDSFLCFITCHQPVSARTLSSLCVVARTAHDFYPPQGPLLMGGEGMLCFHWDSRWIVCTINFPRCHEVGAVIARGNINNYFPCAFYVSVSQECHADTNTVLIHCLKLKCAIKTHGPSKSWLTAACFKRPPQSSFEENKTKIYSPNIAFGGNWIYFSYLWSCPFPPDK